MCGGSDTKVVERPADTTVDTSQPQFANGQERARRVYGLNKSNNKTLEGDLNGQTKGAVLGA